MNASSANLFLSLSVMLSDAYDGYRMLLMLEVAVVKQVCPSNQIRGKVHSEVGGSKCRLQCDHE